MDSAPHTASVAAAATAAAAPAPPLTPGPYDHARASESLAGSAAGGGLLATPLSAAAAMGHGVGSGGGGGGVAFDYDDGLQPLPRSPLPALPLSPVGVTASQLNAAAANSADAIAASHVPDAFRPEWDEYRASTFGAIDHDLTALQHLIEAYLTLGEQLEATPSLPARLSLAADRATALNLDACALLTGLNRRFQDAVNGNRTYAARQSTIGVARCRLARALVADYDQAIRGLSAISAGVASVCRDDIADAQATSASPTAARATAEHAAALADLHRFQHTLAKLFDGVQVLVQATDAAYDPPPSEAFGGGANTAPQTPTHGTGAVGVTNGRARASAGDEDSADLAILSADELRRRRRRRCALGVLACVVLTVLILIPIAVTMGHIEGDTATPDGDAP